MRITFMVSGGFAAAIRGCCIDTTSIATAERADLERLVAESGLEASFARFAASARDLRQYDLAIAGPAAFVRVSCDDVSLPAAARPLVAELVRRSTPQPPTFFVPDADQRLVGGAGQPAAGEAWGHFVGDVVAKWDGNGRDMILVEPFAYVDPGSLRWDAPSGSVVDGASIPRAFWSLIGGPFEGRFRHASVVHDVACVVRDRSWQSVHRMFHDACRCGGVGAAQAVTMYYAVHHFGPRWSFEERRTIVAGRPRVERVVRDDTPPPPTQADVAAVEAYFAKHEVSADDVPTVQVPGVGR